MRHLVWLLLICAIGCSSGGGSDSGQNAGPGGPGPGPGAPPTPNPAFVEDQVLVMLEDPDDVDEVDELREDFAGITIERIGQTAFFVLTLPNGTDPEALLDDLDDDLRVVNTELNYVASAPEGDPSTVPTLGSDIVASIGTQDVLRDRGLDGAHQVTRGAGVVVAVVDTGVDPTHPALVGKLNPNGFDFIGFDPDPTEERNFTDDDGDGLVDEQFGHGTFIASLILAVAPDATILPIRVLDDEGFGTSSSVAAGIVWAVDNGADVINLSAATPIESEAIKDAIDYAKDRDVVVVGTAGNDGALELNFPARQGEVLSVTAVNPSLVVPDFANVGSELDLAAPGVALIGAVPQSLNAAGTARWSGTSFAAPVVAGGAALVRAAFPGFAWDDVTAKLRNTAESIDPFNPGVPDLGSGAVDLNAAVR